MYKRQSFDDDALSSFYDLELPSLHTLQLDADVFRQSTLNDLASSVLMRSVRVFELKDTDDWESEQWLGLIALLNDGVFDVLKVDAFPEDIEEASTLISSERIQLIS